MKTKIPIKDMENSYHGPNSNRLTLNDMGKSTMQSP